MRFGPRDRYDVGLRLQHLSNGGIRKPNPGIDFVQLRLQYHLR
jgi:lipid A 3-O-deacylase